MNYVKKKIPEIALRHGLKKTELTRYYEKLFFESVAEEIDLVKLSQVSIDFIADSLIKKDISINEFKFLNSHNKCN